MGYGIAGSHLQTGQYRGNHQFQAGLLVHTQPDGQTSHCLLMAQLGALQGGGGKRALQCQDVEFSL